MIKKTLLALFCLVLVQTVMAQSAKPVNLTFSYQVTNTIEGYAYVSKLVVYVDDQVVGESTPLIQTKPNSVTVSIPKGNHKVRAVLMAQFEGNWEERTKDNNYSWDFEWTQTGNFSKNRKIKITFDIDKGVSSKG
ncbi:MAG: hypothetical protein MH137_14705 [Flavobacteriales bacterium]|nr:hypothetical protein [Flavobacteriales bacterium]